MTLGPNEFNIVVKHGAQRNFHLQVHNDVDMLEYEKTNGKRSYERYAFGMSNLCMRGLVGLNTKTKKCIDGKTSIESSYYWTNLGNDLLLMMGIIDRQEVNKRRLQTPIYFNS